MFEVDVQVDFYKMGFLSLFEMIRNVSVGFVVRMLPNALMKVVFKMPLRICCSLPIRTLTNDSCRL
jgi:predicted site-specific integrase-resolvase